MVFWFVGSIGVRQEPWVRPGVICVCVGLPQIRLILREIPIPTPHVKLV